MKPLRTRLSETREQLGLSWEVIERDYLLSWILAGIAQTDLLKNTLVFKGGTALRKCYFGNYRLSEDLDFTGIHSVPTGDTAEQAMQEACIKATALLNTYAPIEIICKRHIERNPHPNGQEAFDIWGRLPWQRQAHVHVMVEITVDEPLIKPAVSLPIIHAYGETINAEIMTYSLEEIIAEKLRAVLQQQQLLARRGWVRSRARDYYDLWRILSTYENQIDTTHFNSYLQKKCLARQVSFQTTDDFFPKEITSIVEKTWNQWLEPLVGNLPDYHQVMDELKIKIPELL